MDLQIKSSRVVLATESAVRKLKELKEAESTDDSFLENGCKTRRLFWSFIRDVF